MSFTRRISSFGIRAGVRRYHPSSSSYQEKINRRSALMYVAAGGITMIGVTYGGVPLYRKYCQALGLGGNSQLARVRSGTRVEDMVPVKERKITVEFRADTNSRLEWNFKPEQRFVKVYPGETALAFYSAKNPTETPVTGIATYNVLPPEAGKYFNKIQCFCFEEQRLNPGEEVDMPVFFYIDPEYEEDPRLLDRSRITLSYTFFKAKPGLQLPIPGYASS